MYSLMETLSPAQRQQPETVRRAAEVDRFMSSNAFRKEFAEIRQNVGYLAKEGKRREDQALEEKKQREFDTKIRGMQETCRFFNELGAQTGNAGMQTVAAAAFAGTELYAAGTALASSIASNGFMSMATVHPVAMAATAALTIFGLCRRKKRKGPDFSQVFMENMRIISQQIHDLHVETRTMRQENFEMHQHLLETMHQGFIHLEESFHGDMESLETTMTSYMQRIESNLNQWGKVIAYRQNVLSLEEFRKVKNRMEDWVAKRETEDAIAKVPKYANLAGDWLKIHGTTALPMYTGLDLIPDTKVDLYRHIKDVVFPEVNRSTVAERRGFLGYYNKEILKMPIDADYGDLFDPTLWFPMLYSYFDFRATFGKNVLDPDHQTLNQIKEAAEVNIKHIQEQQRASVTLFQSLFKHYQDALQETAKAVSDELKAQSTIVDVSNDFTRIISTFNGKHPENQIVKGGTRYNSYGPSDQTKIAQFEYINPRTGIQQLCSSYGATRDSFLRVIQGIAVDFPYTNGTLKHAFPPEFLLLEKMKLGTIKLSYTADYKKPTEDEDFYRVTLSDAAPKYWSRCITVKFVYAATGLERHIMKVNQQITFGNVASQSIEIDSNHQAEAKNNLATNILSLRKNAVKNVLVKMDLMSPKFDAYVRLILANAIELGCKDEDIVTLKSQLITYEKATKSLRTYLSSATIDTALPLLALESLALVQPFIKKLQDPKYFNSFVEKELQRVVHALEILRSEEILRQSLEPDEKEKTNKVDYQQGYELGNAFALSMIVAALQAAGHQRAAQRVSAENPDVFQIENAKIAPEVKEGLLQSISLKIMELVPKIIAVEQPAAMWLLTFASTNIRTALESKKPLMIADVIGGTALASSSGLARLSVFAHDSGAKSENPSDLVTQYN